MALLTSLTTGSLPSTSGVTVSVSNSPTLMTVDLIVAGNPGTSPTFQLEVLEPQGTWVSNGSALTAAGQVSTTAYGTAVRLNSTLGSSPGTGATAPYYFLNVNSSPSSIPTKESAL